jgi:hypothetical protein
VGNVFGSGVNEAQEPDASERHRIPTKVSPVAKPVLCFPMRAGLQVGVDTALYQEAWWADSDRCAPAVVLGCSSLRQVLYYFEEAGIYPRAFYHSFHLMDVVQVLSKSQV